VDRIIIVAFIVVLPFVVCRLSVSDLVPSCRSAVCFESADRSIRLGRFPEIALWRAPPFER
jgi:hypothetical protein